MTRQEIISSEKLLKLSEYLFANEDSLINEFVKDLNFKSQDNEDIDQIARQLVSQARDTRKRYGGIDAFLHEYGLSTYEGIMLMCLAEALLRIPDKETADQLIVDKIGEGDWAKHIGHSESFFVNASSWALMLTGQVIDLQDTKGESVYSVLKRMIAKSGEPIIREAMKHSMRILGGQFVLGQTIKEALTQSEKYQNKSYIFSYDMLGEAACTQTDADLYYERYVYALKKIPEYSVACQSDYHLSDLMRRPSLSIKLSALHARYEDKCSLRVLDELVPKLLSLIKVAREVGIGITIDAEEASKLELSLRIFTQLFQSQETINWPGLGLAVQAYGKRALPTLSYLSDLSRQTDKIIPVRLVKGAYWDSEIKWAQEQGLKDYPVFTRKVNTDVSYIKAAKYILDHKTSFYPQFATHNAHTIATIMTMANDHDCYEFQRLHGMGEGLYEKVISSVHGYGKTCRIYAPVGGHEDLLAYLVRRLLENGANTSFVNRLADDEMPIEDILINPVDVVKKLEQKSNPYIPKPKDLFYPERENSLGLAHWDAVTRNDFMRDLKPYLQSSLVTGSIVDGETIRHQDYTIYAPHDVSLKLGTTSDADLDDIERAFLSANAAYKAWDMLGGERRSDVLKRAAELYEENRAQLVALLINEAGKTIENAYSELREAIDFLRYYATQASKEFSKPFHLTGPTGEENLISLHGRGCFVCISPWNFPLAIFTGQISAAIAAGNSVVAKPAEQTPLIAFVAVQLLHKAGVPENILQLLIGPGETVGDSIIRHKYVSGVAFTGSDQTARLINLRLAEKQGPIVPFIAETGGVNAMIVDSSSLPEQVVRDVVHSAFDSAGQRCSALRVLFLQNEVADKILGMLKGAVKELRLGDPSRYETDIGPVIDIAASNSLNEHKRNLQTYAKKIIDLPISEEDKVGHYIGPAIYELESFENMPREIFGPILHVFRYDIHKLDDVCQVIQKTGYGLTLGIHSRITERIDYILDRVQIGNIYINRNQIGAVVGVQPFGGEGLSGTGPKAGGQNYLRRFAVERVRTTDTTASGGNASLLSLGIS